MIYNQSMHRWEDYHSLFDPKSRWRAKFERCWQTFENPALIQKPVIGVEAGPAKVIITEETPWSSIAKLLVTIWGTFLGMCLINKYIK